MKNKEGNGVTNSGILPEVALYKMLMLPNENDFDDIIIDKFGWVKDEFCVWIRHSMLDEFIQYLIHEFGYCGLDAGGMDVKLQDTYIVINLCELFGDTVNIESVFPKEKYTH